MIRMGVPPSRSDSVEAPARIGRAPGGASRVRDICRAQGRNVPWRRPKSQRYAQAFLCKLSAMSLGVAVGLLIFIDELINFLPDDYALQRFMMGLLITIAIVLILFSYSLNTDRTVESHLHAHRLASRHGKGLRQAKKTRTYRALYAHACSLANYCAILSVLGGRSRGVSEAEWSQFQNEFVALHRDAVRAANALGRMAEEADFLDDRTRDAFAEAAGQLGESAVIDNNERTVGIRPYQTALESLDPVLALLRPRLGPASAPPRPRPRPAAASGGMTLRLDCDTYPPGAAITVKVKADGQFPHHRIPVTIRDERLGKLAKKTETAPTREPGRDAAIAPTLRPKGLEIGREYTARAECGSLVATAAFAVDDVDLTAAPAVHAHGPTCAVGGYMDIAVVDPAACVGGTGNEPAGAAKRPRLVIELPGGEARDLHLEDAYRSGGAFHWRVGCVGDDGGGLTREDTPGGEGTEDPVITCEPGQMIRIKYESAAGESRTAVLVEGSGATSAAGAGEPGPESGGGNGGTGRPAAGESGSGGDDGDAEPPPRGRKGGEASRMQGAPEGKGGRGR